MQFDRVRGDPGQRRADVAAGGGAPVGVGVQVECAESLVVPQSERAAGVALLRIDPDQAGGVVGAEVFDLHDAAALRRGGQQRAAFFALHHVVRPEALADVPADDAAPGAELPVAAVGGGVQLVDAAGAGVGAGRGAVVVQHGHGRVRVEGQ